MAGKAEGNGFKILKLVLKALIMILAASGTVSISIYFLSGNTFGDIFSGNLVIIGNRVVNFFAR